MPKESSGRPRRFREVPNPQVVAAAEQFHKAYRILGEQGQMSGVILPELHCAFIALELYLKSLSATEVEVPDTMIDTVTIVYASSPARSHYLDRLYDRVDREDQEVIDRAVAEKPRLHGFSDARSALAAHNDLFASSRYSFEPESPDTLKTIDLEQLKQLLEALEEAVHKVRRRYSTE